MRGRAGFLLALLPGCVASSLNEQAFYPRADFRVVPEDYGLAPETFLVPVDGALLHAWRFRAAGSGGDVLVVYGGNSDNKELFLPLARGMVDAGLDVVLCDGRGFGLSTGAPDLWSLVPDGEALLRRVCADPGTRRVAVMGVSLGSPVALAVAARVPQRVDAVIVESLLVPRPLLARQIGGFATFLAGWALIPAGFDVAAHARALPQPVLFVHGAEDDLTELPPAAEVFAGARHAPAPRAFWIAPEAGHAPGIGGLYGSEYMAQLLRFLEAALHGTPDRARVDVGWDPEARSARVELRSARVALGSAAAARTPVEVTLVRPEGFPLRRRVSVTPGQALQVPFPDAGTVIGAFGDVPAGAVAESADGSWQRTDPAFLAARDTRELEAYVYQRLDYGSVLRVGDGTVFFRIGEGTPAAPERMAACAEVRARLEAGERDGLPAAVRLTRCGLWRALARRFLELEDRAGADAALARALAALPPDPFGVIRFGDSSWQIGFESGGLARELEDLAGLTADAERRAELLRLAEEWKERGRARSARLQEWAERSRAERDRLAQATSAP